MKYCLNRWHLATLFTLLPCILYLECCMTDTHIREERFKLRLECDNLRYCRRGLDDDVSGQYVTLSIQRPDVYIVDVTDILVIDQRCSYALRWEMIGCRLQEDPRGHHQTMKRTIQYVECYQYGENGIEYRQIYKKQYHTHDQYSYPPENILEEMERYGTLIVRVSSTRLVCRKSIDRDTKDREYEHTRCVNGLWGPEARYRLWEDEKRSDQEYECVYECTQERKTLISIAKCLCHLSTRDALHPPTKTKWHSVSEVMERIWNDRDTIGQESADKLDDSKDEVEKESDRYVFARVMMVFVIVRHSLSISLEWLLPNRWFSFLLREASVPVLCQRLGHIL